MSQVSDKIRKSFGEGDARRDAGLITPENIVRYDNILYGEDLKWNVLDVYRPGNRRGELPVIVSVHGGGWVYGDKDKYQFYCMNLAQRGFAVVNFSYRLAPENKYPAPIEDTNKVFAWLMEHADVYGMDTDKIFAVGDSAGGSILALYAAICTNKEYAREYNFQVPQKLRLCAIALNCGIYCLDFNNIKESLTEELLKDYLPEKGTEKELNKISVVNYITGSFPPVYFMTAVGDFLKEQPEILGKVLAKKNIPFVFHRFGNEENPLCHVFHLDIRSEAAKTCTDEEIGFFQSVLREKKDGEDWD